jgi:phospholipid-binding lipoprotein MlaA
MHTFLLKILLCCFIALPAFCWASDKDVSGGEVLIESGGSSSVPDLLADQGEGYVSPDLLEDDPYFDERRRILNDPIFEDDFTFNKRPEVNDPLEPLNRAIFIFNDKVYFWVLKPTKNAYAAVVPRDIRSSLGNAFANIGAPVRFINSLLQGKIEDAGIELSRFLINSTLGVLGLGDPASRDFDIEPRTADFGQTLGIWGVGEGVFICLPFLGPSTVRDSFGFVGDVYLHPVPYLSDSFTFDMAYLAVSRVNLMSITPDVYEELKRLSLDPYVAARQAFYDYRRTVVPK